MKKLAIAVLFLLQACATRSTFDCPDLRALGRASVVRTVAHENGRPAARGRALAGWDDPYNREMPHVRAGTWEYWYDDGAKRAAVTYALSCYIQCCSPGPCPQVHDYPTGSFILWHRSGAKLGQGTFHTIEQHVDTSCEGGDDTKAGVVSNTSRFWREDGSAMTLDEARASGLLLPGW